MKKALIISCFFSLQFNLLFAESPVVFEDPNLKQAVESELGVSDPTPGDMLALDSLSARNMQIGSVVGLEYAINLTNLDLYENHIEDISPLSGLIQMRGLCLARNQIRDINAVSAMVDLTELYLGGNRIHDLEPVSNLHILFELSLLENDIHDISPLENLHNLRYLGLLDNAVADVQPLARLTNLETLLLGDNCIKDISALSGLNELTLLYLANNKIRDVSALSGMDQLLQLLLHDNQIQDICPVADLPQLLRLTLSSNNIHDISCLADNSYMLLWLEDNPLNTRAHCIDIPQILSNRPDIEIMYDPKPQIPGDINYDCRIDFEDMAMLCQHWLEISDIQICSDFFNVDPGWTMQGQWEFGTPSGEGGEQFGHSDPNRGKTGENVYGVNLHGDYSTEIGGPYYLTAGPFDCTDFNNVCLTFSEWLNSDDAAYVAHVVEVSNNNMDWELIWQHSGRAVTDSDWGIKTYDISSVADNHSTLYIRWGYQVFEYAYPYSGWNIDDIELWGNP